MSPNLRRRLLWLIGGRAAVVTLLLGSAILIQIQAPGSLPIDPFFFLIGLTYALTVVYVLLLKQAEQHRWLVDVQLACDAVIVSALVYLTGGVASYFTSLYALPIIAASTIQSRRSGMMVGVLELGDLRRARGAQYFGHAGAAGRRRRRPAAAGRVAFFIVGLNIFGFMAVAALSGWLAERLRRTGRGARAGVEPDRGAAGVQRARHQQPDRRPGDDRHRRPDPELQQGRRRHHRRDRGVRPSTAARRGAAAAARVRRAVRDARGAAAAAARRVRVHGCADGREIELGISTAHPAHAARRGRVRLHLPGRHRGPPAGARGARFSSAWRRSGRWPPASPTRFATRWRRCRARCRSCGRSCRSSDEQSQLMDIVLRESDRLNDTIRSFLAYARPQRNASSRLDVRQVVTDAGDAAAEQPGAARDAHRSAATCRPSRCGASPTRRRFGRSSGTWRPTVCARWPTAAR